MGRMQQQGESYTRWVSELSAMEDSAVVSISAQELDPYGSDFSKLRAAHEIGWVGNSFRVILTEPFKANRTSAE